MTLSRNSADAQLLAALLDRNAVRPAGIEPGESISMRLIVLATSPLWVTAIAIAMLSRLVRRRLPLLVLHERVGFARSTLWVPKIATARVERNQRLFLGLVERASGPPVELAVDSTIERRLRETGADELPQLVLVLAGTMRLVGPRPVTPSEIAEMFAGEDPVEAQVGIDHLHPGLVGLWQVLDRHGYELPERRALDLAMIDNWSPRLRGRLLARSLRQAIDRIVPRSLGI